MTLYPTSNLDYRKTLDNKIKHGFHLIANHFKLPLTVKTKLNTSSPIKPINQIKVSMTNTFFLIHHLKTFIMKKLVILVAIFFVSMVSTLDAQRTSENHRDFEKQRTEKSYSKAGKHKGKKCGKKHKIKHKNQHRKMHKKAGYEGSTPRGDRQMNREGRVY
jgi:hypothetical protein